MWGIPESSFVEFVANIDLLNAVLIWRWDIFVDALQHLILPAAILGLNLSGPFARYARSSLLEVIRQDYLTTARAKGLREQFIILRHALPNALIPLITVVGIQIPALFAGAVVIEQIFSWPGMGRLIIASIGVLDRPVIVAYLMMTVLMFVIINLVVDILYSILDPRVRMGQRQT